MTDSLFRSAPIRQDLPNQPVTEADVLITHLLRDRPARSPDLAAENQALRTLAQHLTDEPQVLLKTLVRLALDLCQADTAGVSLLDNAPNGESVFRWVAIAGALAAAEGGTTPANFSPCGTTLRANQPQLYAYPERYFTYLAHPQLAVVEGMLIPLRAGKQSLGTLWVISHSQTRHFDAEDQRLMMSLSGFTASALDNLQKLKQQVAAPFRQTEVFHRQILDQSDDCIKVLDLEGRLLFMSPGGRALMEIEDFTPFLNRNWSDLWQESEQQAVREAIAQARAGKVCTFQGYLPTLAGEPKWWDCKVSPMRGTDGQIDRLLCISRDITVSRGLKESRKQAEERVRQTAQMDAFRVSLNDALRPLADPLAIQSTASQLLGEYLGANRVAYFEVRGTNYVVEHDYVNGVESLRGSYPIDSFGSELLAAYRKGQTATSTDVTIDSHLSPNQRSAYANIQIAAYIGVPLIKQGNFVAGLAVHHAQPRAWTADQITLIEEVAERIWAAVERAHVESALRRSESKYRSLFNSMDEGFCILQVIFDDSQQPIDCRYVEVNPSFEQQSGVKNVVGKTVREVVPNIEPFWFERYGKVVLTGEPIHFFEHAPSLDRWFDVNAFRIGEPQEHRVAVLFTDITERKRAELEIQKFASLANNSTEFIGICDLDFMPFYVNPAGRKLVGLDDLQHYKETPVREFFFPEDQDFIIHEFFPRVLQEERAEVEIRFRHFKTGEAIWMIYNVFYLRDENDQPIGLASVSRNITERKRAEAALAADLKNTQLLRDLSAHFPVEAEMQVLYDEIIRVAIALMGADAGTLQSFDPATQNLAILASEGITQEILQQFSQVSRRSNTSCSLALATGQRSFVRFDVPESEDPDGALRAHFDAGYQSAQSTPLIARSGKIIGMVSTHWKGHHQLNDRELRFLDLLARQAADLIEQRQAEAERKQLLERERTAREAAEQANRVKDEFLAVLSHELRSPLNPILGWCTLLLNGKLDPAKTHYALLTIQRNAKLQSELIEDLLDVSRILSGKLNLNSAPVNVAALVTAAMETVRLAAEAKSITLEANLEPNSGQVLGDATRLQQVVWNLLSNAVKFTSEGGQVKIRLEQLDSCLCLRVSDTGQGIAPDFLPYVFDYFRQADSSTTRKFGGLGLGLAIVRHLVELHGGTVQADSPGIGQGATFTVRLPLMQTADTSDSNGRSPDPSTDLRGIRVLVVDDEADSREYVAFVLEQAGATVAAVATACEALTQIKQSPPDILISDIGMPDMNGYMLMQQIRALFAEQGEQIRAEASPLPAIALTAYAGEMNQQQAIAAGFQKHIAKPIDPETLIQIVFSAVKMASPL